MSNNYDTFLHRPKTIKRICRLLVQPMKSNALMYMHQWKAMSIVIDRNKAFEPKCKDFYKA